MAYDNGMREGPPGIEKALPTDILSGWKDIATYLNKGVRTVQRYERFMALPVRHPSGRSKGGVIATKAELDAWVAASPLRKTYRLHHGQAGETSLGVGLEQLRTQVTELRRLRQETASLRRELQEALQTLRTSVYQSVAGMEDILLLPSKKIH